MKMYMLNGRRVWLDENDLPEGADLCGKKKESEKIAEPAEVKTETKAKARKAPANKSRKAGSNK